MINWYKDGYYWRHPDPPWALEVRGADSKSKGDVIFNTLSRIVDQEDRSEWAYLALMSCRGLLIGGKRWPDPFNQEGDCRGHICHYWQKLRKALKCKHWRHGPQRNLTRDPWILFYVASYKMNRFDNFNLKPHWRLFRPNIWAWMKYLRKGDRRYLKTYYRWTFPNKREYVQRLHYYISLTL